MARIERRDRPRPHIIVVPTTDEECRAIEGMIGTTVPAPFSGEARLSDGYGAYYLSIAGRPAPDLAAEAERIIATVWDWESGEWGPDRAELSRLIGRHGKGPAACRAGVLEWVESRLRALIATLPREKS